MKKFLIVLLLFVAVSTMLRAQSAADIYNIYADLAVFDSPLALNLKKGVNKKEIFKIGDLSLRNTALKLLEGNYEKAYRYALYQSVLDPAVLGRQLGFRDGYSKYAGVTGIYLPKGKNLVLVDGAEGKQVKLLVPNWMRKPADGVKSTEDPNGWHLDSKEFLLHNGVNIIELHDWDGLAYIQYFSKNDESLSPVEIHFPSARVNGYFDLAKHNNVDWNKMLSKTVYPVMDAVGKHIQVAYLVEDYMKYADSAGVQLISNYDALINQQYKLMGLIKYNRIPENRILSRANFNYYMFRDDDGVAYMAGEEGNAMAMVVDPNRVMKGDACWGFSHEVGHVHQLQPLLSWGGLGEVSNNILALHVNKSFGTASRIAEQDNYSKARLNIINGKISYLQDEDHFNRLVPFWQLQLYFDGQGVKPDFYPDLFEALRSQLEKSNFNTEDYERLAGTGHESTNPALYQLNFIQQACLVGETDLIEFFDQYGFFYVGDFSIDDYGKFTYSMTQEMVDACKTSITKMNLPKPNVDIASLRD